jgi:lipid A ethanolaminephosphotransferase
VRVPAVSTAPALALGCALFVVAFDNRAFWTSLLQALPADCPQRALLDAAVFLLLLIGLGAVFLLLAWPYVFKPVVIAILLASALCQHFMLAYGVVIDRELVQSALETDRGEVADLIGSGLLLHVALAGVLPGLLVACVPLRIAPLREELRRRVALLAAGLVVAGATSLAAYKPLVLAGRRHPELRRQINPIGPAHALLRQLASRSSRAPRPLVQIALDARRVDGVPQRKRPLLVVLVVGETARAASFSLNGYARDTNPRLAALDVLSYTQVRACGTSTSISVPCMFSARGSAADDGAGPEEGLLDVLQRVGVRVLWRDNNAGCKHACDRVPTELRSDLQVPGLCKTHSCMDQVLLENLQERIDALDADSLIVLHQLGSHGPAYQDRSPAELKRYGPECDRTDLETCTRASIRNAYDNSILYTDWLLARLIATLSANAERFDTAMLYVSDHGESLGENGVYLHGLPWLLAPDEQTRVPMILWLSDGIRRDLGIDAECMRAGRDTPLSHAVLFHSLLGLFDVSTQTYRGDRDVFSACRPRPAATELARAKD